jgi:ABC-type lipoprotein release transport system permease subunit
MLFNIAWRNIWRSKLRSFVVIGAVIVGIWALIFLMSFVEGMINSYIYNAIQYETSHIQLHHPKYKDDREIQFDIQNAPYALELLGEHPDVLNVSQRLLINGMLSTANGVRGAVVKAIDPASEKGLTHMNEKVIEGDFFETESKNPIVVSKTVAEKLKLKLRSKVVLNFQKVNGDLTAAAFRVVGIYKTSNRQTDELVSYTRLKDVQELTGMGAGRFHEIAMSVADLEFVDQVRDDLRNELPGILVESYKEISPDLELFNSQIKINMIIMTAIVMLALIFGIINTMLMAVLERVRELGMLMAIGMNKIRVFKMIVLETILISIIGTPIGLLLGYLTVSGLNKQGIDLSLWAKGLEKFGMSNVIRPTLQSDAYITIVVAIVVTAVIGSIYPSIKAIRLKPVEALRKL